MKKTSLLGVYMIVMLLGLSSAGLAATFGAVEQFKVNTEATGRQTVASEDNRQTALQNDAEAET